MQTEESQVVSIASTHKRVFNSLSEPTDEIIFCINFTTKYKSKKSNGHGLGRKRLQNEALRYKCQEVELKIHSSAAEPLTQTSQFYVL